MAAAFGTACLCSPMGWEGRWGSAPKLQQCMPSMGNGFVSCLVSVSGGWERWAGAVAGQESNVILHLQHHPLPGVGDLPDDGAARPGEAGRLAPHLHHLHPQWHHWQSGQCHLPAVPGGGEGSLWSWGGALPITLPPPLDGGTEQTCLCARSITTLSFMGRGLQSPAQRSPRSAGCAMRGEGVRAPRAGLAWAVCPTCWCVCGLADG